ncbi:hypothetical protein GCM10008967_32710 [Bacillus carboniphilus]|uniref:Uncharacterized protein n=1 Tax=Bacillus carboniphilus TaxID=86663 RepID=A0ABN0WJK9_9BACI
MHNADNKKLMFIVFGIIISISSLLWGLLSSAVKQTLFMPKDAFFFGADGVSIFISMGALFVLGISIVIVGIDLERKKLKWSLFAGLFGISLLVFVATMEEYYYYSPDGIYTNELAGFGTDKTDWEEIVLITNIFQKDQYGSTLPKSLIFDLEDGRQMEMNLGGQLLNARKQIDQTVRALGADSIIRILDPEGNIIQESLTPGRGK